MYYLFHQHVTRRAKYPRFPFHHKTDQKSLEELCTTKRHLKWKSSVGDSASCIRKINKQLGVVNSPHLQPITSLTIVLLQEKPVFVDEK